MTQDRYQKGLETMKHYFDTQTEQMVEKMEQIFPDFAKINVETFGEIYGRPFLDAKTRELLTIAALIALGNAMPQLKAHILGALRVGVTKEEILETILQMTGYVGFPTAINALHAADEVFCQIDQK